MVGCTEGVCRGVHGGSECKKVIARRGAWRGCMEGCTEGVRGGSECKNVIARRGCAEGLSAKGHCMEGCTERYAEGVCGGGAWRV